MTIELTAEMEAAIAARVAAHQFADPQEVLREALAALDQRDFEDAEKLARFRAKMQASEDELDRGDFVDGAEVFASLRERARLMRQAAS